MRTMPFGSLKGLDQLTITVSVFFFLILSNTVGPTFKKVSVELDDYSMDVQQSCMPCSIGAFHSVIDTFDILEFIGNSEFEKSPDISYAV